MDIHLSSRSALLAGALIWSLLLVVASFLLPVVTMPYSGIDGPQPRVSLVEYFGPAGVVPALVVVSAVGLVAWLLDLGQSTPSDSRVRVARIVSILVCAATVLAMPFTHFAGLFAFVAGLLLVLACAASAPLSAAAAIPGVDQV